MDVYSWVIFMYVAGTILVGWFLLHETGTPGTLKKKDSLVGPTYWGVYNGSGQDDLAGERTIKLQDVDGETENSTAYPGSRVVHVNRGPTTQRVIAGQ